MERKTFEYKATLDDAGLIEGYGAVTGNRDSYDDIIVHGAYKNLGEFVQKGSLLIGHDWGGFGVGTIEDARETDKGLFFKSQFHSDDEAQKVRSRVKERMDRGKFVGLSIGYRTLDAEMDKKDGVDVRLLKSIEVFEISLVTVPANPLAGVTGAKSFEDEGEGALAALNAYIKRARELKTLRESEGRNLSELNRSRIEALAADIEGLLPDLKQLLTEPPKGVSEDEIAEVHRAMARYRLTLAGIPV